MAVSVEDFARYINKGIVDDAMLPALEAATSYLDARLGSQFASFPEAVHDRIVLMVAHDMYKAKDSPAGQSQFSEYNGGQQIAAPRDPLNRVWPLIRGMGVMAL